MAAKPNAEDVVGPRSFGLWTCLALVVGNTIGTGIFLLPASLAPYGINALFGWLLTIAGSLCLAFVFARLAASFPKEGGPYAYSRLAFGEGPAFALAWSYWISICVTNATVAIAATSYLTVFAPALADTPMLPAAISIAILWTLTLVNIGSIRAAGGFQLLTTLLKLLPLGAAMVIALVVVGHDGAAAIQPLATNEVSLAAITASASLTLWAMLGFESATVPAGRVRDPERNIPRATLYGTLLIGTLYLLASTSIWLLLPAAETADSNAPFADFVRRYVGSGAAMLIALFATISAVGALNGWVLLQGEMPLAMARRGVFPRAFGRTSRAGTPLFAQLLSSGLATLLILSNYARSMGQLFTFMALLATVATLVMYVFCGLACLRLMQRGEMPRTGGLVAAASLGVIYGFWTFYGAGAEATGWGAVLLASGIPVYLLMRRARGAPSAKSPKTSADRAGGTASLVSRLNRP